LYSFICLSEWLIHGIYSGRLIREDVNTELKEEMWAGLPARRAEISMAMVHTTLHANVQQQLAF